MNCNCHKDVVGARLCIYPMQDDFVDVILGAVRDVDRTGLAVITNDLGTTVQGKRERVFSYVKEVFVKAAVLGGHVVANVTFSGGCPGDVPEDFDFAVEVEQKELQEENIPVACAWSLYPMGNEKYMEVIESEVTKIIKAQEVEVDRYHYCTRLDGTVKAVFAVLENSFAAVRKSINHTIIHATISKGSPSKPKEKIQL